ncbi:MAG: hypothetical protein AAF443_00880 [Chlamydiota bacterium]
MILNIKSYSLLLLIGIFFSSIHLFCLPSDMMMIEVPVHVNGVVKGTTSIDVAAAEETIAFTPIFDLIFPLLNQKGKHFLRNQLPKSSFIPSSFYLEHKKIQIVFRKNLQIVDVHIDLNLLKRQDIDLRRKKKKLSLQDVVLPEPFSAYSNFSLSEEIRSSFTSPAPSNSNFFGVANACTNYRSWILEGFLYLRLKTSGTQTKKTSRLNRGNIFLTKDWEKKKTRFVLGDIYPRRISFQYSAPLFGLQVLKNLPVFRPDDINIGPIGRYEFFLNAPSQVDVYVNGILTRTLQLGAGPHQLNNFPLADGLNKIDLKVTDPANQISWINLNQLYNPKLLNPGEYRYSVSIGFPRFQSQSQRYKYLFNKLGFSSLFEMGITSNLGVGAYLQGSGSSLFSGLRLIYATPHFELHSELGSSLSRDHSAGIRGKMTLMSRKSKYVSWRISADALSSNFSYFQRENITPEHLILNGSISPVISKKVRLVFSGSYSFYRHPFPDTWSANISLSTQIHKYFNFGCLASYKQVESGKRYFEGVFSLTFAPNNNPRISSSYNTATQTSYSSINYYKKISATQSINAEIGATSSRNKQTATGSIDYQGERGEVILSNYLYDNTPLPLPPRSNIFSITRLTARTALVYAGGTLALSRPINDNFAIIAAKPFLRRYPILVNPSGKDAYMARSTRLFPAVVTRLPSYTDKEIIIGSNELPIGYDLGKMHYYLRTKYKCGFKIAVGKGKYYYAEGILLDQDGAPIRYRKGLVAPTNSPEDRIFFFTNGQGKFCLMGILPQHYQLELIGLNHVGFDLIIPDAKDTILDLGNLQLQVVKEQLNIIEEEK